jgi:hypothetical protein
MDLLCSEPKTIVSHVQMAEYIASNSDIMVRICGELAALLAKFSASGQCASKRVIRVAS